MLADLLASLVQPVGDGGFLPHALCLSLEPQLLWLHMLSDGLIAISYYSIPIALVVFALRRRDVRHRWVLWLFGAFIMACGTTHLMHIYTLFVPDYWLEGLVKAMTAAVSLFTAILLWPLLPRLIALPSPAQLEREIAERRSAEAEVRSVNATLEERVRGRTAELEAANHAATVARHEAERANAAKSKFLAAASHDLRQPVQALVYFSNVLALKVKDDSARAVLGDMQHSIDAIGGLLDSLLDVSKLDAGIVVPTVQEFSVAALLERMQVEFAPMAADRGLRLTVMPCEARIVSDPHLLGRIVQNLVANAVRYTASGRILIGCRRAGAALRICVLDTGSGIPQDRLDDIFEEFTQLENPERDRSKGLGLGLAIVDRLSRLLGHPVAVRSTVGRGSMFAVSVPIAASEAGAGSLAAE